MQRKLYSIVFSLFIALFLPSAACAVSFVTTDGGLMVSSSKDSDYWFQIGGALKVDQRIYWGGTHKTASPFTNAGTYDSGAFVRDFGLTLSGGVGKNYTYTVGLNFDIANSLSRIDDAYVTYHGFKNFLPNFTFDIGQVVPGFCIHCATSSKWIPFLERNMGVSTFGPEQGMGVNFNTYDNAYTASLTLTQQPRTGEPVLNPAGQIIPKPDMWQVVGRVNYRPVSQECKVFQVGVAADFEELSNSGLRYNPKPEMRSGSTITLLDTAVFSAPAAGSSRNTTTLISAKNQKTLDLNLLWIFNSWSGDIEYQRAYIARGYVEPAGVRVKQGANLVFSGYHAQMGYVLTGECRTLKLSTATIGQVVPRCAYGAWEVYVRYSFISLNDQDVSGGMAHNTSASLCWYINKNLKAITEYVYSKQERQFVAPGPIYLDKRVVQSIGARLQAVF